MPLLPEYDPANFEPGAAIDNPYFPLPPGQVRSYAAVTLDEETGRPVDERNDLFVTFETREVAGVRTVVVRDTEYDEGFLVEDTLDYYAQDTDGNVWYLGELSYGFEYDDDGVYFETNTDGSWEAGVDGASGSWQIPAEPGFGAGFYQEFRPGVAVDEAIVVGVGETVEIGAGTLGGVVRTLETTVLEPDVAEFKYFAPGVGEVLVEEDLDNATGEPGLRVELTGVRGTALPVEDDDGNGVDDEDEEEDGEDDADEPGFFLGDLADKLALPDAALADEPEPDDFAGDGSELYLTFLEETAGYDSAVGVYTFDLASGQIGEGRIAIGSTEDAAVGDAFAVTVAEGQGMGVFLVPNGAEGGLDLGAYEDGGLLFENFLTGGAATLGDTLAPLVTDADGTPLPIVALHALGNDDGFNFLNPAAGVNAVELEGLLTGDDGDGEEEITVLGFDDQVITDSRFDGDYGDVVVAISGEALPAETLSGLTGGIGGGDMIA